MGRRMIIGGTGEHKNTKTQGTVLCVASSFTKCLDALPENTSEAKDGIQVVQSTYSADDKAQKWYFYEADSVTDGEFIKSTAEYTPDKNYIFKTFDAFGNVTQYDYDTSSGLLEKVTDPEGNETVYTYNADNSIDKVTAVNGNLSTTVDYTYENDLLTKIEALNGTIYNFIYDSQGRTDEIKVKDNLLSDIVYNSNGTISEMRYGNGAFINYIYDDMGRTKYKYYNDDYIDRIEYYYNASGNLGVVVDYLTNETTRYIYDLSSRLAEVEVFGTASLSATNVVKSIKYTYADKTNYLTEVEYDSPLGTQSYNYNYGDLADGEMPDAVYSVDYNGTTQLEYTYDAFGRLTERNLAPINKTQTFTYKQGGYGENSTSTLVETVTVDGTTKHYTYDDNGNIINIDNNNFTVWQYEYNANNELIWAFDGYEFVGYDYNYQNGNIISVYFAEELQKTFSYTDTNWPDKLTAFNGNAITYDAIGNPLTYHDGKVFTWVNGRSLATVTQGNNSYSYTYNSDGIRTSKTVNGTTTQFIYADGVLLGQKTGNNTLLFLYDESGNKFGFIYNGAYYYYDINLQGDVECIYNSNGVKVVTYEYDPWGVITYITDTSGISIGTINPIRYRGYYYDNETGFYYLQSRYYDPNICRFINADTITDGGAGVLGYNLFIYAANNPINNSDPSGKWIIKDAIKWVAKKVVKPGAKVLKKALTSLGNATRSSGITASVALGVEVSISLGITTDNKGHIGFIASGSMGVGIPSASVSGYINNTNAPDIYKQRGSSTQVGGSADIYGIGAGAEISSFQDPQTKEYYHGTTISAGISEPIPAELHGGKGYSFVYGFNMFDIMEYVYIKIMEW